MTDSTLLVKDADATTKALAVYAGLLGVLTPYHLEDTTQRAALLAAIEALATETTAADILAATQGLATQTTLAAVLAKLTSDPSTATLQTAGNASLASLLSGQGNLATQTTLAAVLAKLTSDPSTATLQSALNALVTTNNSLTTTIGTRAYAAPLTRVTVSGTSTQSAAITGTEVALCFVGASAGTFCYVKNGANPTATANDIPLQSGALFHMRITTGDKIAVVQDTAGGSLNIIPVA